ncbi:hypothetical protein [Simkania sp.]|uniref:hypothetical protein n=1 Tax=Simkania sp. TaxID=34094 RepID=UPI003B51BD6E
MAKERTEIADEHKWNVASLYPSLEAWEKGFKSLAKEKIKGVRFPEIQEFQGKMHEGPALLAKLLTAAFANAISSSSIPMPTCAMMKMLCTTCTKMPTIGLACFTMNMIMKRLGFNLNFYSLTMSPFKRI